MCVCGGGGVNLKWYLGFSTRSHTIQPVQSQKMAKSLKFQISKEEGLHYLCSENKDVDQLCSYCTADLRLLFLHRQTSVLTHNAAHIIIMGSTSNNTMNEDVTFSFKIYYFIY